MCSKLGRFVVCPSSTQTKGKFNAGFRSSASNTEVQNDGRIEIYDGAFLETSPLKIVGMLRVSAQDRPKRGAYNESAQENTFPNEPIEE